MEEKININKAGAYELQQIKHIGPVRAGLIIKKIFEDGPIKDFYELSDIAGLGRIKTDQIIEEGIAEI